MAARITRAKKKIAAARIPYRVPTPRRAARAPRTRHRACVHLVFTTGHARRPATGLVRAGPRRRRRRDGPDVAPAAAGRAARQRTSRAHAPRTGPTRDARSAPDGTLVLLAAQDRTRWDRGLIDEATGARRRGPRRRLPRTGSPSRPPSPPFTRRRRRGRRPTGSRSSVSTTCCCGSGRRRSSSSAGPSALGVPRRPRGGPAAPSPRSSRPDDGDLSLPQRRARRPPAPTRGAGTRRRSPTRRPSRSAGNDVGTRVPRRPPRTRSAAAAHPEHARGPTRRHTGVVGSVVAEA